MEDLFKKFLYTGVGLVSATAEKIQTKIDELVDKGSLSEEEGKKVVDDLLESTEGKKEEYESKFKEWFNELSNKVKSSSKSELTSLTRRIEAIEAKLGIENENDENIMKG